MLKIIIDTKRATVNVTSVKCKTRIVFDGSTANYKFIQSKRRDGMTVRSVCNKALDLYRKLKSKNPKT